MKHKLPIARSESVVVQELENETLIYDFEIDKAFCLNATSTIVYRHCDGKSSFEDLNRQYKYSDDLIFLALSELQKLNLIQSDKITHFAGLSRREAIRKVGLGTLAALPIITALAAPTAAQTASNCAGQNQDCLLDNFKQSNCCPNFRCSANAGARCRPCLTTNQSYYQDEAFNNTDQATCNAVPERNLCCNPAATPTVSGSDCLCG